LLQRPGDEGASYEARAEGDAPTDVIILTHDTVEGEMDKAIAQMQALPTVLAPIVRIRKEELK
jgi:homoserine dehydrogenase